MCARVCVRERERGGGAVLEGERVGGCEREGEGGVCEGRENVCLWERNMKRDVPEGHGRGLEREIASG